MSHTWGSLDDRRIMQNDKCHHFNPKDRLTTYFYLHSGLRLRILLTKFIILNSFLKKLVLRYISLWKLLAGKVLISRRFHYRGVLGWFEEQTLRYVPHRASLKLNKRKQTPQQRHSVIGFFFGHNTHLITVLTMESSSILTWEEK